LGLEPEQTAITQLALPTVRSCFAGPVGSGKSTTMYNCLEQVNDPAASL
jgi:type II secretory ATPase GspE/PulE/Tfp pilus assembly ATPase PilB-like protein